MVEPLTRAPRTTHSNLRLRLVPFAFETITVGSPTRFFCFSSLCVCNMVAFMVHWSPILG